MMTRMTTLASRAVPLHPITGCKRGDTCRGGNALPIMLRTVAAGVALAVALAGSGQSLAAASAPHLTFLCSTIPPSTAHPTVTCRLAGRGFAPHEALGIAYQVEIQWMQGSQNQNHRRITTQQRRAMTDAGGAFRRPAFWFTVPTGADVRVWKIWVQVQVVGAHGERTTAGTGGSAD